MAVLKKQFVEKPENLTIDDLHLEKLVIAEITEWRKIRVNKIIKQTDKAVRILPALTYEDWYAKELLREGSGKEFWLKKWKYEQVFGKHS